MTGPTEKNALAALITLLDDPDEKTYALIQEKIFSFGMDAVPHLEKALENTFDHVIQKRIEIMIRKLYRENIHFDFLNWLNLGSSDLLKGFVLVTKTQYPDLDEEKLFQQIEEIRMDIWLELNDNLTALENVKVLNHLIYDVHHFDGNKINPAAPQNAYLNSLLETRKGSPLSLGMLYIILAHKLGLPVYGVNLPQHFILAYLTDFCQSNPTAEDVLFYINPFNKGAVFTRREIELYISQLKVKSEESFFAPCSNVEIIKRLLNNLIFSYNQLGYPDKIEDLEHLLNATDD